MPTLQTDIIGDVLAAALSRGADFAELFFEDTYSHQLALIDSKVENAVKLHITGVGIRVIKGLNCVFASTADLSRNSLVQTARDAAAACEAENKAPRTVVLQRRSVENIHPVILLPTQVETARKTALLHRADKAARAHSDEVVQVSAGMGDTVQNVLIANSDGLLTEDRRVRTRFFTNVIASDGVQNQTGFEGPGRSCGFELFDETVDVEAVAKEAARTATTMLHAGDCPAGSMPVAIENGFGGVIFHEACGHSLESEAVGRGNSEFAGKLGETVASSKVTAIDDGTMPGEWGSTNIDDEGTPTQRTVLIDKGVLKSYMVDNLGGKRCGLPSTGSGRRQGYQFAPVSRMRNTYIDSGEDKNEDIIASIETGLYCKKMGGGSVNPVTGEFNFAVSEGYLIQNGKITEPVRGASLIGKGSQVIKDIDMVGQTLAHGQGMCGSASGSVPTNVGQPLIRVKTITVGGKAQ